MTRHLAERFRQSAPPSYHQLDRSLQRGRATPLEGLVERS